MFQIVFSQEAEKELSKLEKNLQKRIFNALDRIKINPSRHVEKLVGLPYYKLRVGNYRLVISIKIAESTILISKIGHRKNIYKNLNL